MSEHDHDGHTHATLSELHECIAYQRQRLRFQMLVVLVVSLLAIGMWISR